MNLEESPGGSSSNGQENGDASNGSERPLKKARFAWQVKGKYHLKNDASDPAKTSTTEFIDPGMAGSSGSGSNSNNTNNIGTEQNLEILSDYLLKQDFNTLDSVIADPDTSLLKPSTTDMLPYPRYVSSQDNIASNNASSTNSDDIIGLPISMIDPQTFTEDQCIARWQARQMAKGFVDNTINRVLDSWIQVPLAPDERGSRVLALDVAEFINNLPGDNTVENEGILMAITTHGLQSASSSFTPDFDDLCERTAEGGIIPPSIEICISPFASDDESQQELDNDNNDNIQSETESFTTDSDNMPWSYSDEQKNNESDDITPFPLFPSASSFPFEYLTENLHSSNVVSDDVATEGDNHDVSVSSLEYINQNHHISDGTSDGNNHCDFLDAAVLYAIQSKGLTTFGTDYG